MITLPRNSPRNRSAWLLLTIQNEGAVVKGSFQLQKSSGS